MTDPQDLLEIVASRNEMIRTFRENPKERYGLVDHVDASKSTVYKAVTQRTERELVESTSTGLDPTLLGIVALAHYERFEQVAMMAPVLEDFPGEAIPPSAPSLRAEIVEKAPADGQGEIHTAVEGRNGDDDLVFS